MKKIIYRNIPLERQISRYLLIIKYQIWYIYIYIVNYNLVLNILNRIDSTSHEAENLCPRFSTFQAIKS